MSPNTDFKVMHDLAEFCRSFRTRAIPQDVLHAAARCIVDWMAAVVPGGLQPPATLLAAALRNEVGAGLARLIPVGTRLSARAVALINGCAAHTIEFDDIYRDALYHPGAPTISAALAIAQERHIDGDLFLRSVIAGYEVSTRIGVIVQPTHYNFWHTTGTVGTFGAAAAVATALRLETAGCANALATSGTLAAGLQQAFRSHSMSKPMHSGHAAETGLLAALAAEQGVTGAWDILEGPRGFGAAMSGNPDFSKVLGDLNAFNIRDMTFKNYSCCGHTFAAIDAARELRSRHQLTAGNIDSIEISTYAKALEVAGNPEPQTVFEAQFSLPYAVGVTLATGSARLDAFTPERLQDTMVRALMAVTKQSVNLEADAAYPRQRAATVIIHTRDGETLTAYAPTRKGDPDNPLSDGELSDKFMELVAPLCGSVPARRLLDALWNLSSVADIATFPLPLARAMAPDGG
jgi:2-methylcitrate dehydratase PrpD